VSCTCCILVSLLRNSIAALPRPCPGPFATHSTSHSRRHAQVVLDCVRKVPTGPAQSYSVTLLQNLLMESSAVALVDVEEVLELLDELTRSQDATVAKHASTALVNLRAHAEHRARVDAAVDKILETKRRLVEQGLLVRAEREDKEERAAIAIQKVMRGYIARQGHVDYWAKLEESMDGLFRAMEAATAERGVLPTLEESPAEDGRAQQQHQSGADGGAVEGEDLGDSGQPRHPEIAAAAALAAAALAAANSAEGRPMEVVDGAHSAGPPADAVASRRGSLATDAGAAEDGGARRKNKDKGRGKDKGKTRDRTRDREGKKGKKDKRASQTPSAAPSAPATPPRQGSPGREDVQQAPEAAEVLPSIWPGGAVSQPAAAQATAKPTPPATAPPDQPLSSSLPARMDGAKSTENEARKRLAFKLADMQFQMQARQRVLEALQARPPVQQGQGPVAQVLQVGSREDYGAGRPRPDPQLAFFLAQQQQQQQQQQRTQAMPHIPPPGGLQGMPHQQGFGFAAALSSPVQQGSSPPIGGAALSQLQALQQHQHAQQRMLQIQLLQLAQQRAHVAQQQGPAGGLWPRGTAPPGLPAAAGVGPPPPGQGLSASLPPFLPGGYYSGPTYGSGLSDQGPSSISQSMPMGIPAPLQGYQSVGPPQPGTASLPRHMSVSHPNTAGAGGRAGPLGESARAGGGIAPLPELGQDVGGSFLTARATRR